MWSIYLTTPRRSILRRRISKVFVQSIFQSIQYSSKAAPFHWHQNSLTLQIQHFRLGNSSNPSQHVRPISLYLRVTIKRLRECPSTIWRIVRRWQIIHQQTDWRSKFKLHRIHLTTKQRQPRRFVSLPSLSDLTSISHIIKSINISLQATSTSTTSSKTPFKQNTLKSYYNASATNFRSCESTSYGINLLDHIPWPCLKWICLHRPSLVLLFLGCVFIAGCWVRWCIPTRRGKGRMSIVISKWWFSFLFGAIRWAEMKWCWVLCALSILQAVKVRLICASTVLRGQCGWERDCH